MKAAHSIDEPGTTRTLGISTVPQAIERARLAGGLRRLIETVCLVGVDVLALGVAGVLAIWVRVEILPDYFSVFPVSLPENVIECGWWIIFIYLGVFAWQGLYTRRLPYWREFENTVKGCTLAYLIVLAAVSLGKLSGGVSRTLLTLMWVFALCSVPTFRYVGKNLLARAGIWRRRIVILGAGKTGELVAGAIARDPFLGYEAVGFLDDDLTKGKCRLAGKFGRSVGMLGGFSDAERVMEETGVRTLVVAAPGIPGAQLVALVNRLQRVADKVLVIPDLFGMPVVGAEADYLFDEQALVLRVRNNLANPGNAWAKRFFDVGVGFVALVLCLPLMLAIAVAIRIDSSGPVLFSHKRIGRNGLNFGCLKFRTMHTDAEQVLGDILKNDVALRAEWERDFKLKDDPRVTMVGKFLRRTSLDELPQIFNVLKGEMSLVGPRPIVQRELSRFGESASDYLQVRPGVTGLWQVSGRSEIDYPERVRLEAWYVRNWSLWLDVTLLLRTLGVILGQKGAY